MQRTSQNGGMGAALGGGAAESAFGSETNNILTKGTIYGTIAFFLVSLSLYLLYQSDASKLPETVDVKTLLSSDAEPAAETATSVVEADGTIGASVESVEVQAQEVQSEVEAATQAVTIDAEPAAE
jgi:preprotein translocase subunit SecG